MYMWRRLTLWMLAACMVVAVKAKDRTDGDFFVRAECRNSDVIVGDSCLVVFRLYSRYPVQRVEKAESPKVKGCRVRSVPVRRATQRVRLDGTVYYAVPWQAYYIVPEKVGDYKIPECKYEVVLSRGIPSHDPFERFWGRMERYEALERSAKSGALTVTAKKNPPRSTEEMLRSGAKVF